MNTSLATTLLTIAAVAVTKEIMDMIHGGTIFVGPAPAHAYLVGGAVPGAQLPVIDETPVEDFKLKVDTAVRPILEAIMKAGVEASAIGWWLKDGVLYIDGVTVCSRLDRAEFLGTLREEKAIGYWKDETYFCDLPLRL